MLSRKHIKAPKTFDPGQGRPREHLAYLNKAEMEMLRVLTDGKVESGPKGLPSFAVSTGKTTGSSTARQNSASMGGGPGGGSLFSSVRTAPSTGSKPSSAAGAGGASSGRGSIGGASGGKAPGAVAAKAPASGGAKAPAAAPAPAKASPAAKSAPRALSGIGSPGAAQPAPKAAPRALSGIGSPGAKTVAPAPATSAPPRNLSGIGAPSSDRQASATKPKTASALSPSQSNAYKVFGAKMAAAPRAPEVPRTPGDAERMARMAIAESGIIRDETGKMNPVGAQAIMSVIRNRMQDQDQTVGGVISQRAQFSPWGDGKYSKVKPSPSYTALAEQVLRGVVPDVTKGADTYHNRATVLGGYSTAGAATKDRVRNNFRETFGLRDTKLPGTYGHEFGVAADGSRAVARRPAPQRVAPGGIRDGGDPARPVSLPAGALSQDPNYGTMGMGEETRSVPGRFGGSIPSKRTPSAVERISTQPGPINTQGAMTATGTVPMTFKKSPLRVSNPSAEGLTPKTMSAWQQTLNAFGREVPIVSAYRDPKTNEKAGGAKKSRHMQGDAIDVDVRKLSVPERQQLIKEARRSGFTGIGIYGNSIHFDMGNSRNWGPDRTSRTTPSWAKAAINGKVDVRAAAATPSAPAARPGGVLNTLARGAGIAADVMGGKYVVPGDRIRAGMSDPAIGTYARSQQLPGFIRAGVDGAAGKMIGPAVRQGFADALSTAQSFVRPREQPASAAAPVGYSGVGYPMRPGFAPAAGPGTSMAPPRSNGGGMYARAGEGSRNPQIEPQQYIPSSEAAMPMAAPMAPAPAPPVDWSYFTNVKTREQALRALLGEEWYA